MKPILKKSIKFITVIIFIVILVVIAVLKPIDRSNYKESSFYTETLQAFNLKSFALNNSEPIKCGWSKQNITPDFPLQIASYGLRPDFEAVHDSMFVRSFVFKSGDLKSCIVTMDLLIVPPAVVQEVLPLLAEEGFSRDKVYFSATHTHNAAGGWAENIGGRFLAGEYSDKMVKLIANKIRTAIVEAERKVEEVEIGFGKINAEKLVENRLVGEEGTKDPWLRILKFRNKSGENAILLTFAAHANCMPKEENVISCDYPGFLVDSLEHSGQFNFAAFCAGAVGSMRPGDVGKESFEKAIVIADSLYLKVKDAHEKLELNKKTGLKAAYFPVMLREPNLKISNNIALRPYVFNWLLGKQEVGISSIVIGDILFVGMPCDFSGELGLPLDSVASENNKKLLITSFNGAYIGYITPDKYYDLVKYETREMNWFGPGNGSYFSELTQQIINKSLE